MIRADHVAVWACVMLAFVGHAAAEGLIPYRAVTLPDLQMFDGDNAAAGIAGLRSWPQRFRAGTTLRAQFLRADAIILTRAEGGNPLASCVRLNSDGVWTKSDLPIPDDAIGSLALDAFDGQWVVGACLFAISTPRGPSIETRAAVWRATNSALTSFEYRLPFGSATPDCGSGEDLMSTAFWSGVAWVDESGPGVVVVGLSNGHGSDQSCEAFAVHVPEDFTMPIGEVKHLAGTPTCSCPDPASVPVNWLGFRLSTCAVSGASGPTAFVSRVPVVVDKTSACVTAVRWDAEKWRFLAPSAGVKTVRRRAICPTGDGPPVLQAPGGDLLLERAVEINSVWSEGAYAIAGGEFEFEVHQTPQTPSAPWCTDFDCTFSHAGAFLNPFGAESEVLAYDLHYTINIDYPGAPASIDNLQSRVAGIGSSLDPDADWIAVGSLLYRQGEPGVETSVGVIWLGDSIGVDGIRCCGHTTDDPDSVITLQYGGCGSVPQLNQVEAVHDVLATGVAIGTGRVGCSAPLDLGPSVPMLLTEATDINGDLRVDGEDLTAVFSEWTGCEHPQPGLQLVSDLNGDGCVDGLDLTGILSNWSGGTGGRDVLITGLCADGGTKLGPLPIHDAVQLVGFSDASEFGGTIATMPSDAAVSACILVIELAQALLDGSLPNGGGN